MFDDVVLFEEPLLSLFKDDDYRSLNASEDTTVLGLSVIDIVHSTDPFNDGSLVAKYEFDSNAKDTCGNYDGAWSDNEAYSNGKFGECANFSGNTISFDTISLNSFTFSCWLKFTSTSDGKVYISADSGSGDTLFALVINEDLNDGVFFTIRGNEFIAYENKSLGVVDFHHCVWTRSGNVGNIYIDNIKITDDLDISTDTFEMCKFCRGDFTGLLDQSEIYNRALTAEEIQALYTQKIETLSPNKPFSNDYEISRTLNEQKSDNNYSIKNFSNDLSYSKHAINWYKENISENEHAIHWYKEKQNFAFNIIGFIQPPLKRVIIRSFDDN